MPVLKCSRIGTLVSVWLIAMSIGAACLGQSTHEVISGFAGTGILGFSGDGDLRSLPNSPVLTLWPWTAQATCTSAT